TCALPISTPFGRFGLPQGPFCLAFLGERFHFQIGSREGSIITNILTNGSESFMITLNHEKKWGFDDEKRDFISGGIASTVLYDCGDGCDCDPFGAESAYALGFRYHGGGHGGLALRLQMV